MHAQKEGRRTDNLGARPGGGSMPISSSFTPGERDAVPPTQDPLVDHGTGHQGIPTSDHIDPLQVASTTKPSRPSPLNEL